jgi:hypothetical protein
LPFRAAGTTSEGPVARLEFGRGLPAAERRLVPLAGDEHERQSGIVLADRAEELEAVPLRKFVRRDDAVDGRRPEALERLVHARLGYHFQPGAIEFCGERFPGLSSPSTHRICTGRDIESQNQ